ncbi:hypothetical protein BCR35DRAFT_178423 [Leucosporidium creatinivorum]|uniref:Protein kinase domain-containing protein n=1 Tax=Leucosporidium creatinivorum TaxID=106004 RepID=A0A1Y2E8Q6_9BASI|nr:hypothetical protein BCR35DRAFT_178423 [Leucosporidium creatinivorum]
MRCRRRKKKKSRKATTWALFGRPRLSFLPSPRLVSCRVAPLSARTRLVIHLLSSSRVLPLSLSAFFVPYTSQTTYYKMASTEVKYPVMLNLPAPAGIPPWRRFDLVRDDRYKLGSGAAGSVYRIRPTHAYDRADPQMDEEQCSRVIVLKVENDETKSADVYREAKIYEEIKKVVGKSNHFPRFYGLTHVNGMPSVALERAETSLSSYIETHANEIDCSQRLWFALQIAEGISDLHRCNVFHNDLKPDNILVGVSGRVMIADFGLASFGAPNLAHGTLAYMSPESLRIHIKLQAVQQRNPRQSLWSSLSQLQGEVVSDGKLDASDVWALGATVLKLVHGNSPGGFLLTHVESNKPDLIRGALNLESDAPTWKTKIDVNPILLPFFDMTLVKRPARKGLAEARVALEQLVEHDEVVPSTPAAAAPPPVPQRARPNRPPRPPRPPPVTSVARCRSMAQQPRLPPSRPQSQRLPSHDGLRYSVVASPSPSIPLPPPPRLDKPPARMRSSPRPGTKDDGEGHSSVVSNDADQAESTAEGEGGVESVEGEDSEGNDGERLGDVDGLEEISAQVHEEQKDGGAEEEEGSSAMVVSPLARRHLDLKGKGKARAPFDSLENLHLSTRPSPAPHRPQPSTSATRPPPSQVAAPRPIPRPLPTHLSASRTSSTSSTSSTSASSPASPTSAASKLSLVGSTRSIRTIKIIDLPADCQRNGGELNAKLGQSGGMLSHYGHQRFILTTSERKKVLAFLEANKDFASAEDWERLEVAVKEVGRQRGRRGLGGCRFKCVLCGYDGKKKDKAQYQKPGLTQKGIENHIERATDTKHQSKLGAVEIEDAKD